MAREVKRRLALTTPAPKGQDVKALQQAVNRRYRQLNIDHQISEDGEYGRQSAHGARQVAVALGVGRKSRKGLRHNRINRSVQRLLRGQRARTRGEKIAAKARAPYRRKLRKRFRPDPGKLAVAWAHQQIGITESPAGSNRGPQIDRWQAFWGLQGVSWCGCFAGYAVRHVGGAKVTSWLPYAPSITADAKANRNGLKAVPYNQARAGDLATFWNGQHIGLVDHVEGDRLWTVEGNTSSGTAGSQSNGGGVFARVRSRSDVDAICRPDYR